MNCFNRKPANKLYLNLGLLFLASVVITLPIAYFGIPNGNDLPQHYQFALTFRDTLQNGDFYPSWSHASNFGFGDVGIRFYPPLSYYVLIAFEWLAGNWFDASVLAFGFWFFLGGIGVYFLAREWFGENASLIAGLVYIFAPYHANQIYNAFTYAEFAASAILPFCFLFITRICRNGKFADIIGLTVFYALLVLTHLPMTVIGSLGIFVFSLASLPRKNLFPTLVKLAVSGFFGLLASSFYWVRMASELNFLNHATEEFTSKAYDFHVNFLAAFLYVSPLEYDERSLWFSDLMLLITFGLFVPGVIIFYCRVKDINKPKLFPIGVLLIFSVFMATPLSLPIWENFGVLQKVQFPWRWLAIITLGGAIFTAAGFEDIRETFKSKTRPLMLLAIGLLTSGIVFTATQVIKPAIFSSREEFTKKIEKLREAESYDCWLAIWSKKEAISNREKVSLKNRTVIIKKWDATEKLFNISAGETQTVRIALFYYPYWQATINDRQIALEKDENGAILIPLPENEVEVKLSFREPNFVKGASILSIAVWLLIVVCGAITFRKYV